MLNRYLCVLIAFCVAFICLIGCGGGGGSSSTPNPTVVNYGGTISGIVYDGEILTSINSGILAATRLGTPLAGVQVRVEEIPYLSTVTNSNGEFTFDNIPPNQPVHLIFKYQSPEGKLFRERSDPISVSSASNKRIEIKVRQANQLVKITVAHPDGTPIPSAKVEIWGDVYQTDAQGQVLIAMPQGRYEIKVSCTGFSDIKHGVEFSNLAQNELEIGLTSEGSINRPPLVTLSVDSNPAVPTKGVLRFFANAFDYDGDRLTYEWHTTVGSFTDSSTTSPKVTWIAPEIDTTASVSVTVYDSKGARAKATLRVKIGGADANRHPIASIIATATEVFDKEILALTASATDLDGDTLRFYWECSHGTISTSSGASVYWQAPAEPASANIKLTVTDGKSGFSTVTHKVNVKRFNHNPTLSLTATSTNVLPLSSIVITATGRDRNGDSLTYFWNTTEGSITGTGSIITWTTPASDTIATVSCRVEDGYGGEASASLCFTVFNNPPTIILNCSANSVLPGGSVDFTASGNDPDGDSLTYSWNASKGALASTSGTAVTWTAPNETTYATVTCIVTDSRGKSASASKIFLVDANRDPVCSITISDSQCVEGQKVTVSCQATDPNGDILGYSWTATAGSFLTNTATTEWTAGPGPNRYTLTCFVTDGKGGSATANVSIEVLNGKTLNIGDSVIYSVNGETTFYLGTPEKREKFGLIFFPLNTASATYNFEVNGGGSSLPNHTFSLSEPSAICWVDKILHERAKRAASLVKSSIQYSVLSSQALSEAVNIGDKQDFWVYDFATNNSTIRTFDLRVIGSKCKIFRDIQSATDSSGREFDPALTTDATLQEFANEFDSKIYDFIRNNYGREWDKNGDSKVTILFSPKVNAGFYGLMGFFDPEDFTDSSTSNKRDCFYMCVYDPSFWGSQGLTGYKKQVSSTLVHEFQHLVNFCEHTHYANGENEESWLNEGLSVEAQVRYTGERDSRYQNWDDSPENVSITNWNQALANYGGDGLFLRYIYEQLGTDTIKNLVVTTNTGVANINAACASRGGFEGLFGDWAITVFRYGKNLPTNSRYDFKLAVGIDISSKTSTKYYGDSFSGSQVSTSLRFVTIQPPTGYSGKYTSVRVKDLNNGRFKVAVVRLRDS